jgi:hypothetical protein
MSTHIYIVENTLMPGFCKVGMSKNVTRSIQDLYGDWKLYKSWRVE